jgi:hypothetical protein
VKKVAGCDMTIRTQELPAAAARANAGNTNSRNQEVRNSMTGKQNHWNGIWRGTGKLHTYPS